MEDKTPIYMLMIVGMVALVALVFMLSGTNRNGQPSAPDDLVPDGNAMTGNVAYDEIAPVANIGRILLAIVLVGASVYMYHKF